MPITGDLALFVQPVHSELRGLIWVQVDDTIGTGNEKFIQGSRKTEKRFESKEMEYDNITFAGIGIQKQGKEYLLNKSRYLTGLRDPPLNCSSESFRARRHEISWMTHTRPDLCAAFASMLRITEGKFW